MASCGLEAVKKPLEEAASQLSLDSSPDHRNAPYNNNNNNNNKKRSHTQLDSRKQVIAFQDRVMIINIKEAQHPLKREKQVIDKSSIMLKISTKSMHRVLMLIFEFLKVEMHLSWIFALQPTVSGKLMTYELLLPVNRRYYLQYNDYSKVYCSSTLICPIRSIFWKAESRQAIDSYDDLECNSRMPGEGSYRFYFDPG